MNAQTNPIPRPAPQEPPVHGKGLALFLLVIGAFYFFSGVSIFFFPRNEAQLRTWWISVLIGLALLGVAFLLFRRRRRELAAHEQWAADFSAWQQEQQALAQLAHEREMERLQTQLEIEKLSLERTKAQIRLDFCTPAVKSAPSREYEEYRVAGTSYRQEVFERLGLENPDYALTKREILSEGRENEHFDKYYFDPLPVDLEKEPDNPYGDHAVKVLLAGEHVGYIPSESSAHVTELIDENRIYDIDAEVVGGPYKYYDSVEESMVRENLKFGVRLTIYLK